MAGRASRSRPTGRPGQRDDRGDPVVEQERVADAEEELAGLVRGSGDIGWTPMRASSAMSDDEVNSSKVGNSGQ